MSEKASYFNELISVILSVAKNLGLPTSAPLPGAEILRRPMASSE